MKYSELHYERIDVEKNRKVMEGFVDRISGADSADEQISTILEANDTSREYQSYAAMASLNFSRDINDEKAKAEKDYYDSIGPDMQEIGDIFDKAINDSEFKLSLIHI